VFASHRHVDLEQLLAIADPRAFRAAVESFVQEFRSGEFARYLERCGPRLSPYHRWDLATRLAPQLDLPSPDVVDVLILDAAICIAQDEGRLSEGFIAFLEANPRAVGELPAGSVTSMLRHFQPPAGSRKRNEIDPGLSFAAASVLGAAFLVCIGLALAAGGGWFTRRPPAAASQLPLTRLLAGKPAIAQRPAVRVRARHAPPHIAQVSPEPATPPPDTPAPAATPTDVPASPAPYIPALAARPPAAHVRPPAARAAISAPALPAVQQPEISSVESLRKPEASQIPPWATPRPLAVVDIPTPSPTPSEPPAGVEREPHS
jgi:hypothetical protein